MNTYPCPVCGSEAVAPMEPCIDCQDSMSWSGRIDCTLCGIELGGADDPCLECRESQPIVDGISCLGHWCGALREWLSQLKYGGDSRMASWLGMRLAREWKASYQGSPVVPIPPRPGKRFYGGRNPVGLLARKMGSEGIPLEHLLRRQGNRTQKSMSRTERLAGTALHYHIRRSAGALQGDYVLLDDVMTTGATLRSCAKLLKNAGAGRVYGLVVCRD